jgi:hypothetical protein
MTYGERTADYEGSEPLVFICRPICPKTLHQAAHFDIQTTDIRASAANSIEFGEDAQALSS